MEIQDPSLKEFLWHRMREDLCKIVPEARDTNLLMCCACARFLPLECFSLEHIIPRQSLRDDPEAVKTQVPANKRSGVILLCNRPLIWKGKLYNGLGCNSHKGKYFDPRLKEVFNRRVLTDVKMDSRHQVAILCAGYLALVHEYGIQVALLQSGLLMRRQFFYPNRFCPEVPARFQFILLGARPLADTEVNIAEWQKPFGFQIGEGACHVVMRGLAVPVPLSRDPAVPIAQHLKIVPQRYKLRPDFTTAFD